VTNSEFIGNWIAEANNVVSGGARKHRYGVHKNYGNLSFTWFTEPRIAVHPSERQEEWGELESYNARLALLVKDRATGKFELLLNSEIYSPTTAAHMWETKWALDSATKLKSIGLYEIPLGSKHASGVTSRFDVRISDHVIMEAKIRFRDMNRIKPNTHFNSITAIMHEINRTGKRLIHTISTSNPSDSETKAVSMWQHLMGIATQIIDHTPRAKVKNVIKAHLALI
tara:strand:+ start:32 stop:712 length:681 start_codon:yes stop_codon:yes gene_type:complete